MPEANQAIERLFTEPGDVDDLGDAEEDLDNDNEYESMNYYFLDLLDDGDTQEIPEDELTEEDKDEINSLFDQQERAESERRARVGTGRKRRTKRRSNTRRRRSNTRRRRSNTRHRRSNTRHRRSNTRHRRRINV